MFSFPEGFKFAGPALPSFSIQEPRGSSIVNTKEILSGLCFSFALDAKTQTGRAKMGSGIVPTWQWSPYPPDLTQQMSGLLFLSNPQSKIVNSSH